MLISFADVRNTGAGGAPCRHLGGSPKRNPREKRRLLGCPRGGARRRGLTPRRRARRGGPVGHSGVEAHGTRRQGRRPAARCAGALSRTHCPSSAQPPPLPPSLTPGVGLMAEASFLSRAGRPRDPAGLATPRTRAASGLTRRTSRGSSRPTRAACGRQSCAAHGATPPSQPLPLRRARPLPPAASRQECGAGRLLTRPISPPRPPGASRAGTCGRPSLPR